MRLQVKGKNVEVSPSIREYAERKLAKLEKQLAEQTQVEVELSEQKNPSIAASHVAEGDDLHEGADAARARGVARHEGVDRPAGREARAAGEALPRTAHRRAAPARTASRRDVERLDARGRRPTRRRRVGAALRPLADAGRLPRRRASCRPGSRAEPPGWDGEPRGEPGIHGVPRARRWDAVVTAAAPGLEGDTAEFVALADGTLRRRGGRPTRPSGRSPTPFERRSTPPYRAEAVRQEGATWAVGASSIVVLEAAGSSGRARPSSS